MWFGSPRLSIFICILAGFSFPGDASFASQCHRLFHSNLQIQAYYEATTKRPEGREESWPADGMNWLSKKSYDRTFSHLISQSSLRSHIQRRKSSGRSTHVCDLYGSAVFLGAPRYVDSLIGVRLSSLTWFRVPLSLWLSSKRREVTGNIYSRATWLKLDERMSNEKIPAFDYFFIRPGGGMQLHPLGLASEDALRTMAAVHFTILNRAYKLLSSNEGEMFIQPVHSAVWKYAIEEGWFEKLNRSGIRVIKDFSKYPKGVRLIKTKDAPIELPGLY